MDDTSSRRERIESAVRTAQQYRLEAAVERMAAHPAAARRQAGREQAARERVNGEVTRGTPPADRKGQTPSHRLDRETLQKVAAQAVVAAAVLRHIPHAEEIHQALERSVTDGVDGAVRLAGQAAADVRRRVEERIATRPERRYPAQQTDQHRATRETKQYPAQQTDQRRATQEERRYPLQQVQQHRDQGGR